MRGAEAARKLLNGYLAAHMDDKIDELVARYQLPAAAPLGEPDLPGTLPHIALFHAGERIQLAADQWPALLTTRLSVPTATVLDPAAVTGASLYKVSYRLRTYAYVHGADEDDVLDKVDRYLLGAREVILDNLNLGDDLGAKVNPNGWTESYSGVEFDARSARSVGAAYIELTVELDELAGPILAPPPGAGEQPGTPAGPDAVAGIVTAIPPHPALD